MTRSEPVPRSVRRSTVGNSAPAECLRCFSRTKLCGVRASSCWRPEVKALELLANMPLCFRWLLPCSLHVLYMILHVFYVTLPPGSSGSLKEPRPIARHRLLQRGAPPEVNEAVGAEAMNACEKAQEWQAALAVFEQSSFVLPTEVTFNTVIAACHKAAQWTGALDLLRKMRGRYLAPSVVSHSLAMAACLRGDSWESVLEIHRHLSFREQVRASESGQNRCPRRRRRHGAWP